MSTRWHERWEAGRIGFHSTQVHPDLIEYEARFLPSKHRVLVPLCGKTVDLVWLAGRGHEAIGVELVPKAVEAFFAEQGLSPEVEERANSVVYRAGRIAIFCGDMFKLGAAELGSIDRVWDRAALVALPQDMRTRYSKHLRTVVADKAVLLQNVFEYDQSKMSGPPFSISDEEVRSHYTGCQVSQLQEHDAIDKFLPFKEAGNEYWTVRSYHIEL